MGQVTETKNDSIPHVLQAIIQNETNHALWLNTLSLLEHIGSRKILLTQSSEDTSEMILRHATEEARHALFFKKAARTIQPEFRSGYQNSSLVRGTAARIYFAKLDTLVRRNLRKVFLEEKTFTYLAYLYTTTVIEKRAMVIYTAYDEILNQNGSPIRLTNLILEEEGHLSEMSAEMYRLDPNASERLAQLEAEEAKIFARFWRQISEFSLN
ncbi:rubrerythrin [Leptospira levettii]|uniref:Rubrerythrin n=1 Tax=Leptospira levettii TaxID=2023178 RepID=A0AAW5VCE3_9LEPT|nr:rubrerythrin [Leptospira levettii]MCW7466796.1 rubrerythrin [Leptospira levettii]MCW7506632.1 rubrerythrin [Leptospira levettii]MCW7512519.1 rubrerythrin [Leptospira levettii]MCW7515953.1 rubrerythrin [Leptospira levettii]MCW7517722.1 rubrerythrin [Leptospira levettii]